MKTFFTALALAAVLSFQALSPAAAAPYGQHEYGKGKNDGCMYEGYPCSEWSHSGEDSW
jgi:hypothetical protein